MRLVGMCAMVLAVLAAGCGRTSAPVASAGCQAGGDAVLRALRAAPGPVSLEGDSVSTCIRDAVKGSDLMTVGAGFLDAAQRLGDRAERHGDRQATLELGYLVGAVRRGRVEEQGVSAELVRRLTEEARRADTRSAAFRRGERAGRRAG